MTVCRGSSAVLLLIIEHKSNPVYEPGRDHRAWLMLNREKQSGDPVIVDAPIRRSSRGLTERFFFNKLELPWRLLWCISESQTDESWWSCSSTGGQRGFFDVVRVLRGSLYKRDFLIPLFTDVTGCWLLALQVCRVWSEWRLWIEAPFIQYTSKDLFLAREWGKSSLSPEAVCSNVVLVLI